MMATSQREVVTAYVYARINTQGFQYLSLGTYKMTENKPDKEGAFWLFVKEVQVDITPPEGWDWQPKAIAALQDWQVAAREKFAAMIRASQDAINRFQQIGYTPSPNQPTVAWPKEDDDDLPF
jgi:hypothetical protein